MNYQSSCNEILDHFEISLRRFVIDKLRSHFGDFWWKEGVPQGIKKECLKRQNRDKDKKFPRVTLGELIDYTHIGELKDIIVVNFKGIFNEHFGNDYRGIEVKLGDIIQIRNSVRHVRPGIGGTELERLSLTCCDIYEAMCLEIPECLNHHKTKVNHVCNNRETENDIIEEFRYSLTSFDNLPRPEYSTFFGREEERKKIIEHLAHPRAWVVSIDGIGGVGKTALALNCAYILKEKADNVDVSFDYVIWASAKTQQLSHRGIRQVLPMFSDLDSLLNIVLELTGFEENKRSSLEKRKQLVCEMLSVNACLLVLDNLETVSDPLLYDFISDLPSPSKALLTTRNRIEESQRNVRLMALSEGEARELLVELANELDAKDIIYGEREELDRLVNRVGGIPLAIKLAVGRIASGTSLTSYIERLETGAAQEDILEFCFSESWRHFELDIRKVLMAITIFTLPPSEEEIRHVTGLPELRVKEAISSLQKAAFLNAQYDQLKKTYFYSLLPLTTDYIIRRLKENPDTESELKDMYRTYLVDKGHYEEALSQISSFGETVATNISEKEKISNLLAEASYRIYQSGNYSEAIARLKKAESYKETPDLYYTWGVIEREEGAFGHAKEKFAKATKLDPGKIQAWRSWGNMERRLKNYRQAVECYSKVVSLNDSDPKDHHNLGVCVTTDTYCPGIDGVSWHWPDGMPVQIGEKPPGKFFPSYFPRGFLSYLLSTNLSSINSSRFSKKYRSLKSRHFMSKAS